MYLSPRAKLLRAVAMAVWLFISADFAHAQAPPLLTTLIFNPANPQPGDAVTVFVRNTSPTGGNVICPQARYVITSFDRAGTQITLNMLNAITPGGFPVLVCDGPVFPIGQLPAGSYNVVLSIPIQNGAAVFVAAGSLQVGAGAGAELYGAPIDDPMSLVILGTLLAVFGFVALSTKRA